MKKFKVIFVILLWIIFIPIMFMFSIVGNIIEDLFTYFNNDVCLILVAILFLIISIVILLKPDRID